MISRHTSKNLKDLPVGLLVDSQQEGVDGVMLTPCSEPTAARCWHTGPGHLPSHPWKRTDWHMVICVDCLVVRSPTESYLLGAGMTWGLSFPDCTAPVCSTQPGEERVTLQDESGGTDQDLGNPVGLFVPPAHACSTSKGCPTNTGHRALWPG